MKTDWYFGGYAGHLCVGKRCAYHISTLVNNGKYLVSTVGDYMPDGKRREPLGAHDDSFYETMVFHADGIDEDLNINVVDWSEIDCMGYSDSRDAERGHYQFCEKYSSEEE